MSAAACWQAKPAASGGRVGARKGNVVSAADCVEPLASSGAAAHVVGEQRTRHHAVDGDARLQRIFRDPAERDKLALGGARAIRRNGCGRRVPVTRGRRDRVEERVLEVRGVPLHDSALVLAGPRDEVARVGELRCKDLLGVRVSFVL
jgi:hypothetical protein